MSKVTATAGTPGVSFFGLLTIVFITLKLLDKIDWSWWWVLAPLWLPAAIVVGLLILAGAGFLIFLATVWVIEKFQERRRRNKRSISRDWR